ncbi:MAG: hypothetical protein RIQ79_2664 [Verrucomicrobiota bacterium]|jgi:hypothetical protein
MNLRPIIDEVASQADDFLAGVSDRTAARASIDEFVAQDYPKLRLPERKTIVNGVMDILEDEGFFGERFVDSFDADQNADEDSEPETTS